MVWCFGKTTAVPLVIPVWYLVRPLCYVLMCRVVIFVKLVWYFGMTIMVPLVEQNRTEHLNFQIFFVTLFDLCTC